MVPDHLGWHNRAMVTRAYLTSGCIAAATTLAFILDERWLWVSLLVALILVGWRSLREARDLDRREAMARERARKYRLN